MPPEPATSLETARHTTQALLCRAEAAGLQVRPPPLPPTTLAAHHLLRARLQRLCVGGLLCGHGLLV